MTRTIELACGCAVRVVPAHGRAAATYTVACRGDRCQVRLHKAGARLFLWQILPDPSKHRRQPLLLDAIEWF